MSYAHVFNSLSEKSGLQGQNESTMIQTTD